jgi:acetyltransferase-like isoleucine patch superfamily enzyme
LPLFPDFVVVIPAMAGPLTSDQTIQTKSQADPAASKKTADVAGLWFFLRPLVGIRQSFDRPFRRFSERWRCQRFLFQARLENGRVELSRSARFKQPVHFHGRGALSIGEEVILGWSAAGMVQSPILLQPREKDSVLTIGDTTLVMNGCEFIACQSIRIGKGCLIGAGTVIYDSDFHTLDPARRREPGKAVPVTIEDNVWIGRGATILKGVRISRDAVIGARCVVTKDVAAGQIVAGNPMRIVGSVY